MYGNLVGGFTDFSVNAVAAQQFRHQVNRLTLYFVYLGMFEVPSFGTQLTRIQGSGFSSRHGSVSSASLTRESELRNGFVSFTYVQFSGKTSLFLTALVQARLQIASAPTWTWFPSGDTITAVSVC